MDGSWVRGTPSKGLRQINIRYDVSESEFAEIERLLERVPYKKVNVVMRHALLLGAKFMLSSGQDPVTTSGQPPKPPVRHSPAATQTPPPQNAPTEGEPPQFGSAAKNMFDTYGT